MPTVILNQSQSQLYAAIVDAGILYVENSDDLRTLFEQVRRDLKTVGPLEDDLAGTIAQLLWRKHHLEPYEMAEKVQQELARRTAEARVRAIWAGSPTEKVAKPAEATATAQLKSALFDAILNKHGSSEMAPEPNEDSSGKPGDGAGKEPPEVIAKSAAETNETVDDEVYADFLLSLSFSKCMARFEFKEHLDAYIERCLDRLKKLQADRLGISRSSAGTRAPRWGRSAVSSTRSERRM